MRLDPLRLSRLFSALLAVRQPANFLATVSAARKNPSPKWHLSSKTNVRSGRADAALGQDWPVNKSLPEFRPNDKSVPGNIIARAVARRRRSAR
jgi:hypothetical protein